MVTLFKPVPTSLLLRSATASLHSQLEDELQLLRDLTLERYIRVLVGFGAFLAAWEPRVASVLEPVLPGVALARQRSAALAHDLAILRPDVQIMPAAEVETIPLVDSAHALGSLYVLEGSTLGARIISEHLRETLGLTPGTGAAWFAGYGQATGAMWRDFRAQLDIHLPPGSAGQPAAVEAAHATFRALIDVFRRG